MYIFTDSPQSTFFKVSLGQFSISYLNLQTSKLQGGQVMTQSYLNRIIGKPYTHKVVKNVLSGEKRVTPIESGTYSRRESLWTVILHWTYSKCQYFLSVSK